MSFFKQVYEIVKTVPKGKVTTYGDIARALGLPRSAKVVGYALHKNPDMEQIPCYKVVNRHGELAKAFVFGGINVQQALLEKDGIVVVDGKVDLEKYRHKF